ncbi:hypothetical protein LLEC1_01510 [Akanthomyces lecanii]|uniref:Carrier domain-containing protein n=1 Tax=Cordyceps confragosa TaxID=2714763 RepID=A0A179IFY2_CORDF|nr:hypothetical protein LLEC1_01510 [Akanthomyces lecanii]
MDARPTRHGLTPVNDSNNIYDPTKLGHCLHRLLEDAAAKYPANVAIICGNISLTYQELNEAANRFARVLVSLGIGQHDLVGVALDRSAQLVVTLFAVLKTGAAYVPLDATFPPQRIRHTLDVAAPKILVVTAGVLGAFKSWAGIILSVDESIHSMENQQTDGSNLELQRHAEDLAYVIFTSGSTGKPKGVEISHGALCNLLLSMKEVFNCSPADRMLAVTTVTFDIAALELFMPLLCGAVTVIGQVQQLKDAKAVRGLLEQHSITMMQATPAYWQMLLDSGWRGSAALEKLLCGGEAMSARLAARLLEQGGSLWNLYGPTEATVWASAWRVQPGETVIIGNALANYQLYILDNQLKPVPQGEYGELYIGGSGLARGYYKNPELTRASFFDSPFCQGRIYRTGDIGCFVAADKLSVAGRADSQIKVRGYRIELGDVEAALTSHPNVTEAVVICRTDRLIAYFIWRCESLEQVDTIANPECPKDAALRKWIGRLLPPYMMPAFFIQLEAFPMTLNNKIDRKALPDPTVSEPIVYEQEPVPKSAVASTVALERQILAVWSRVLGIARIDVKENFFHVGGNSLRLIQVQAQLEKLLNRPIPVAKLFEHYSIESLAAYLGGIDAVVRKQHDSPRYSPSITEEESVAIVSMACRLPGGVETPEEFWHLLQTGGDAISDVPADRWDAATLCDAGPDISQMSECMRGGFLRSIDAFDIALFGISPQEAREMDPLQLLTLETCWEGFERAGYPLEKLVASRTGVYVGVSNMPAHQNFARPLADLNGHTATGSAGATVSGRVSHVLGLEGPSMTIDTACSSSLVATDLACTALRRGECDMAVACGSTLMQSPGLHVEFSRLGGSSWDGRCRAFSENTDGTGWAEGSVAVVLKRLSDARRDGDEIHAVVRGSAVNHGGRSAGLTTPSGPSQQQVIQRALAAARLQPKDIDYVEAHGTGTKLGDPIEGTALAQVFSNSRRAGINVDPLWVGSSKSNIGHTQAAAGLVGVLKVVLAMQHGILPQTLHVSKPTCAVDWKGAGMALVQENIPWTKRDGNCRRLAGVSSFGIGGTNAHVVVEEAEVAISSVENRNDLRTDSLPFLVSGNTTTALRQQAKKLHCQLNNNASLGQEQLGDLAFSLATTRTHFKQRLVLIADSKDSLLEQLAMAAEPHDTTAASNGAGTDRKHLAMLFAGQGSQVPGMGRDLSRTYPVFRHSLETTAGHFSLERPLLDVMWAEADSPEDIALLNRTDFAQPAIFTLQVALLSLWRSWGVEPEAVLGHSLGEYAAAYAAGVFDLACACKLVQARSRLMNGIPLSGNMISLEASASEVAAAIRDTKYSGRVGIAAHNTPSQTVISGDVSATSAVAANMTSLGRKVKSLDVSHAFHSHHLEDILADFMAVLAEVELHPPQIPFVSCLTGQLAEPGLLETPRYWVSQIREAVKYSDAVQTMSSLDMDVFIELGGRPVLSGMSPLCLGAEQERQSTFLPSLVARKSGVSSIQNCLGKLHSLGVSINWAAYFEPFHYKRVELPTYAFQRKRISSPQRTRLLIQRGGAGKVAATDASDKFATQPEVYDDFEGMLRNSPAERRTTLLQDRVTKILANLVGIDSSNNIDLDMAWQDIGIDSLMEPQLRNQLEALVATFTDTAIPRSVTSMCPNLRTLCDYFLSLLQENWDKGSYLGEESDCSQSSTLASTFSLDVRLAGLGTLDDNLMFENAVHAQVPPKSVFITGATGFVGSFLLQQLLEQGITGHCLVRASNAVHAMERLEKSLKDYDLWKECHKPLLIPVVGDMTKPLLGLTQGAYDELANQVDAICHAGALVASSRPLSDYIAPNIGSTHEILRLASVGRGKSVHFISTFITTQGQIDRKDGQDGYRTSKWMAERMVAEARARGAKASIFRLPSMFASSETGHFKAGPENLLHCLIAGSLLMDKFPALDGDLSAWMPVDYLCRTVTAVMMEHSSLINHDFDFANKAALKLKDLFAEMSGMLATGERRLDVPLDEWRRCVLAEAVSHPTGRFARLADILSQYTDQDMVAMFNIAPLEKHVSLHGHAWGHDICPTPVIDEEHLKKYLAQIDQENGHTNGVGYEASSQSSNNTQSDGRQALQPAQSASQQYPVALSPLRRILCPSLGFYPPSSQLERFTSATNFFNSIPWCSKLINEPSPTAGPIPGCGEAVAFLPHCFNPAGPQHEQLLGETLSRGYTGSAKDMETSAQDRNSTQPPLRHMLSLFRASDPHQVGDPTRPILRVSTLVAFGSGTSGFEGIIHGGLISTILDESLSIVNELNSALGKAGLAFTTVNVTASLNVQFLAPVPVTEEAVCVTTWVDSFEGRRTIMKGEMVDSKGNRLVTVDSVWASVPENR